FPIMGKGVVALLAATAGSFFALGAYYQHSEVIRNIQHLEQRNPHAYFIRRKLYDLLSIFSVRATSVELSDEKLNRKHKLAGILKYGFPSMSEISLNETFDFVTSFDRRNSAIQWMCERVNSTTRMNNERPSSNFSQSEASRVFFLSNIKPFTKRGFNLAIWERLLRHVSDLSNKHGTVYVYTGSIYLPRELKSGSWFMEYQSENNSMVAVPTHFFKVLVVDPIFESDSPPYAEAYVMPNSPMSDSTDIKTLLSDIRDIERSTGLRFFEGHDRNFIN
ncbi:hypothetical protein KR018_011065, partial [Drosophila ironensis]